MRFCGFNNLVLKYCLRNFGKESITELRTIGLDFHFMAICLAGLLVYLALLIKSEKIITKEGSKFLVIVSVLLFILVLISIP